MKRHSYILSLFWILLFTCLSGLSNAQMVYVTKEGKKYHKKNCTLVNEGKKGMDLTEAHKHGLLPCNVCKPDQKKTSEKKSEAIEPKNN